MKSNQLKLLFICVLVLLAGAVPAAFGDWDKGQPYKMHEPQLPDPQGWDVDFTDIVLADDWLCTETGWVSDIHFWFSARKDVEFTIHTIYVKIYSNVPAKPPSVPFSHPGRLLWRRDFQEHEFVVRQYGEGDQGWYDPGVVPPVVVTGDHENIWQANITKIPDPFLQWEGTIYWLDIQVRATDPTGQVVELGWKTTLYNPEYFDNAVFHKPDETEYKLLLDPLTERRLDLAFVITGEPYEFELDFGDAPDRPYPTYLGNNGARHIVVPGFCLGAPVRVSQESAPGAGDFDNNVLGYVDPYVTSLTTADYYQYGTPYGASFNGPEPPLTSDRSHLFLVRASDGLSLFIVHDIPQDASGGTSRMHWEIFGDTIALLQGDDPNEGMTISGGGTIIDSRHGWSTCCTDGFAVGSLDGFWTAIGDFNIPPASTSMNEWHVYSSDNSSIPLAFEMNRRVRLDYHTSLDPEPDGQPNPTATGDDILDGNDDEDGVVFTSPLIPGNPATVDVIASADGLLDAWIDWEGNGSWAGNQIFNSVPLAAGRNSLTFNVSPLAIPNTKRFARFRFSSTGGLSYVGMAMDGEVEDYLVKIEPKPPVEHLKWSQPPIRSNPSQGVAGYKLYATTFQAVDQLLSINPSTGTGSLIGNMTTLTPFGLSDRGTELYTFDHFDANNVVRLDPASGNTMYKIAINPPGVMDGEGGIAFRSDGIGFVASAMGSSGKLWSFDLTVPSSTFIGAFQPSMDGLDFSPDGVLYGLKQGSFTVVDTYELYTIDQTTGALTLVGDTGVVVNGSVAGLTFAPDGTLFAAMNDELYTLDPLTAAATLIGPIGFQGISGLTALAVAEPEPELPVFCGWDELSYAPLPVGTPRMKFVADDYRCIGSMPVTSIHWWGSYFGWDYPELPMPQPESWLITFWSNMPPGFANFSYPETPLWRVRVPTDRVKIEYVGRDEFPLNPDIHPEACFQYYLDLQPDEIFWQEDYLDKTKDNIFWISIVAIYDSATQVGNPWGWKTRPWSWMDDAVTFNLDAEIPIGEKLHPDIVRPLEYQGESYDVAFELDTDPCYIKWEQPFTGLIHWPHYEDVLSMGEVIPPQTVSKYLQKPDLQQGIDVDATDDGTTVSAQILADDFPCTTTGLITDIHVWASWFNDEPPNGDPGQVIITLSIHDDIPDPDPGNPDTYSQPGHPRWVRTFQPGEFNVEEVQAYRQGYYNPCTGEYFEANHSRAYRYDFYIDPAEAFKQEGSPDKPVIYWLNVQARPLVATQGARFGWKTTFFDPDMDKKDVAVFGVGREPFDGPWKPMYHPETHNRLDMAFEITTTTEPQLQIQSLVADDWKCKKETPVTAAVWWGSYIGYRYAACQDTMIVRPQKPDYFLLNIWTDVPAGADPAVPYSHPGDIIWEHRAYNYDEVLVGFDKHPHSAASVIGASCATCGVETDTAEVAQIRADAMAADVDVPVGFQMTNMGTVEPVIFTGHDLSTGESAAARASCGSILYAPSNPDDPNFRAAVSLACGGATVDYYDARVGTPGVSLLSTYDCVMTWPNYGYNDMDGFGNNLADYVDAGGKVILGQWCYPSDQSYPLGGRIITSAYCPVTVSTGYVSGSYNGDGTDCVHNGVTAYDTVFLDHATLLAGNMSDGTFMLPTGGNTLAVAWRPDRRVYYSPGNTGTFFGTGDWAQLTCNMCCCAAAREPVFRYSVRLPQTNWFRQEDVNNIYWFSVVAVFEDPATVNHYPWGWTNHPHAFNDDAVSGVFDPPGGWFWTELYDQTGKSEDMSFMLFTEADCLSRTAPEYSDWSAWGKPDCWCYSRQCRGDINGLKHGPFWVQVLDLDLFKAAFNKTDIQLPTGGICADLDHKKYGPFRVQILDLDIFKIYFNKRPYNYWTKP